MSLQEFTLRSHRRTELIDITAQLAERVRQSQVASGLLIVYVPHTTAAVTINENADPSVPHDFLTELERLVPQEGTYLHAEGNSPAHVKSSLVGSSQNLFIEESQLVLGTWQGVFFCEFDGPRSRKVKIKILPD